MQSRLPQPTRAPDPLSGRRPRVLLIGDHAAVATARAALENDYEVVHASGTAWPDLAVELDADLVLTAIEPPAPRSGPAGWLESLALPAVSPRGPVPFAAIPPTAAEIRLLVRSQLEIVRLRRENEERLRDVEERFRHVADQSPLMFWVAQADGRCSYRNQRWLEFTGQTTPEALGHGWLTAIHAEDAPRLQAAWQHAFATRTTLRVEYRLRRYDGSHRWMLDSGEPRFLHGEFTGFIGSVVDVTDERDEIDQLARERSQMRMALRAGRSGTFEWDIPSGRVRLSPELETLYGIAPNSFARTYRAWVQLLEPEDADRVDQEFQRCFEKRIEETSYEFRVVQPEGTSRWLEAKARFLYAENGTPRRMIGINIDIDARKRSELHGAFLAEIAALYAITARPDKLMRAITSALGRHLAVFRAYFLVLNETGDAAVVEQDWVRDAGAPRASGDYPLAALAQSAVWNAITTRSVHVRDIEEDVSARDASRRHEHLSIRAWASVPLFHDGRWSASLVVAHDRPREWRPDEINLLETLLARVWPVVERARSEEAVARAEAKIRESEERHRLAIEAAQLGTWDYNLRTGEFRSDERCRLLHGLPADSDLDARRFQATIHPEDRERVEEVMDEAKARPDRGFFETEYRAAPPAEGEWRWLRAAGRVFFEQETPVRFIGTVLDVTDVVRARETLADRRKELERTVAERTARLQETIAELESFSYSISHDLRAPLRAMQSFAEIIASECGPTMSEAGRGYLQRLIRASQRMDRLVQDVLVYSRVSRTELRLQAVELEPLLDGILETYPGFCSDSADIIVTRPLPRALANEAALTQCLANLLGNALKFARPEVRPRVEIWAEQHGARLRLLVRDNGIGIAAEAQHKIFNIFERLSRDYEGTGIGLAVVRKAAERMGGSVSVRSTPGQGSTFCLDLASAA